MHLSKIIAAICIFAVAYQARFSFAGAESSRKEGPSFQAQLQRDYPTTQVALNEKFLNLAKSSASSKEKFAEIRKFLFQQMQNAAKAKQKQEQGYLTFVDTYLVSMVGNSQTCNDDGLGQALRNDRQVNGKSSDAKYKGSFEYKVAFKLRDLICK